MPGEPLPPPAPRCAYWRLTDTGRAVLTQHVGAEADEEVQV